MGGAPMCRFLAQVSGCVWRRDLGTRPYGGRVRAEERPGGLEDGGPAVMSVVSPAFPEPPTQPSRQGHLCLTSPGCLDAPCLGSGCGRRPPQTGSQHGHGRLSVRSGCRWLRSAELFLAVPLLRLTGWGGGQDRASRVV